LVFMLFTRLSNRLYGHLMGSTLFLWIACINYFKYDIRKSVFIPKDFTLIDELMVIWHNVFNEKMVTVLSLSLLLQIVVLAAILKKVQKEHFKLTMNPMKVLPVGLLLTGIIVSSDAQSYSQEGYIYYFASNILVKEEVNLDLADEKYNIDAYMKRNIKDQKEPSLPNDDAKPNIVIVMSESFWNPKLLDGIEFTANPVSHYEAFSKEGTSGFLLSPVFAGGTCNSEFQVLTGINSSFYANTSLMYTEKVKNPVMSLASVLHNQGYVSTAIHPNMNWYYQRDTVYEDFGFDRYLGIELMEEPAYKGFYISDQTVNREILKVLDSTEESDFIYAITMQNHGPYEDDRYQNEAQVDVQVTNAKDRVSEQILNTYVQGVYDADKALGDLIDQLKASDEETIVLFFGDHLPYLGQGNKVYEEYGFTSDSINMQLEKQRPYYSVPFLLWSNYELGLSDREIPLMNMNYIGPFILKAANLQMPKYYEFLLCILENYPVIAPEWVLDSQGKEVTELGIVDSKTLFALFKNYQDMVLTDQSFEADGRWVVEDNDRFNEYYKEIRVSGVTTEGESLIIKADNFHEGMTLMIDGVRTAFDWINNHEIQVPDFKQDYIQASIELIVVDEKGKELAAWRNKFIEKP
ncbi:MAG: LTA synthase family protein, partial [Clostridia bacterium]|nr:LTA synthase family protein [Clostridia bacterium]